ncbi:bHLH-MYC_N domain-containing protein [Psidium guajava]|nr:bHLH-MYC_N domain-containing protein [Psidium guajava]
MWFNHLFFSVKKCPHADRERIQQQKQKKKQELLSSTWARVVCVGEKKASVPAAMRALQESVEWLRPLVDSWPWTTPSSGSSSAAVHPGIERMIEDRYSMASKRKAEKMMMPSFVVQPLRSQGPRNQQPHEDESLRRPCPLPLLLSLSVPDSRRGGDIEPAQVDAQGKKRPRTRILLRNSLEQAFWSPLLAALSSSSARSLCRKNPTKLKSSGLGFLIREHFKFYPSPLHLSSLDSGLQQLPTGTQSSKQS